MEALAILLKNEFTVADNEKQSACNGFRCFEPHQDLPSTVRVCCTLHTNKLASKRNAIKGVSPSHVATMKMTSRCKFIDEALSWVAKHQCANSKLLAVLLAIAEAIKSIIDGSALHSHDEFGCLYFLVHGSQDKLRTIYQKWRNPMVALQCRMAASVAESVAQFITKLDVGLPRLATHWASLESHHRANWETLYRNERFISGVNNALEDLYREFKSSESRMESQNTTILRELNEIFAPLWPGFAPVVILFGSRRYSLGTPTSDMDLCLALYRDDKRIPILSNREKNREVNPQLPAKGAWTSSEVLRTVCKALRKSRSFNVAEFVIGARVPIIKFKHLQSGIDVSEALSSF